MIQKFLIKPNNTIEEALKLIQKNSRRCLAVVNDKKILLGTLSDGDIRSALLENKNLKHKISQIYNKKAMFIFNNNLSKEKEKVNSLLTKFDIIPVVNQFKIVVDIIFPGKEKSKIEDLKTSVIIMAGGKGTRMHPISKILPKPLIPLNEKPIISHIIESFTKFGIKNFIISINYKSEIIKAYFKENQDRLNIKFLEEKIPLGTVGPLSLLKNKIKNDFFVINCDTILKINYSDLFEFHKKNKNFVTIVASAKEFKIPYGVCNIDKKGNLKKINEKPNYNFLVSSGIYLINPKILKYLPSNKKFDFNEFIKILIFKKIKVGVYPIDDNLWLDVGKLSEFEKANKLI